MSLRSTLLALVLLVMAACGVQKEDRQIMASEQNIEQEVSDELEQLLSPHENDSLLILDSLPLRTYPYFRALYHNYKPLWFNKEQLNPQGDSLLRLLDNALQYGLEPANYHRARLLALMGNIKKGKILNISALAKADLFLSDACYLFAAHLHAGRFVPDSMQLIFRASAFKDHWDSVVTEGILRNHLSASLDALEPRHYGYQQLKLALRKILNDTNRYAYKAIPYQQKPDSNCLQLIRRRLAEEGYYDSTQTGNDSLRLAKAISKFQSAWRIQPDGKLGKYTWQALGYDRSHVIHQLCMAMERWRWESVSFPETYAFINIPAFELRVMDHDTLVLQSRVVCGKPETPTPILRSSINQMLIYPYWNVPFSIAWKEILPALQRDTSYLRRKNFEVIGKGGLVVDPSTIHWKKYSKEYLPYTFRQRIGEENSLGIVKFNFNNPYGVYLHDTNSKRYFNTSSRAQSHGCIRLENYVDFANFLIRKDSLHYTKDSLQLYFHTPVQRKVIVKPALPIFIRYYTCEADSNGLRIFLDVYRKDEAMEKLIEKEN